MDGQQIPQETPQQRLQRLRSVLQRAVTDRTDPAKVQATVTEDMAALAASVGPLRQGDPLVGELTDTLASVIQLNQQLGEEVVRLRQGQSNAGLSTPSEQASDPGNTVRS